MKGYYIGTKITDVKKVVDKEIPRTMQYTTSDINVDSPALALGDRLEVNQSSSLEEDCCFQDMNSGGKQS